MRCSYTESRNQAGRWMCIIYISDGYANPLTALRTFQVLMGKKVQLRGGMKPPPQLKHQVIISNGYTIVLNAAFSLIPDPKDSARLIVVSSKEKNKPVLDVGNFDYRYFSTSSNLKIRHAESGSIFYFDFDGIFFPKGGMIPSHCVDWHGIKSELANFDLVPLVVYHRQLPALKWQKG